ncbi:hypothetical protein B0T16DRAFT_384985 [Cercophora newfieldiana]|uniref:Uncharacterized protein n=1 Tax=Cercophora newfieldiana TaxID=92897 RepID=A0AA40D0P3_9PEZI|nr:hypothetical protein B0T16DRAFT_384985 [Cercophora newfieldiana]
MRIRPAESQDLARLAEIYCMACPNRPEVEFREPCWQTNPEETTNGILSHLLDQLEDETNIIVVAELGTGDIRPHSRNTSRPIAWMALRWESSECVQRELYEDRQVRHRPLVDRRRREFRNLQVSDFVAAKIHTRRGAFDRCMQAFRDRMVASNTAGWWEITDLVEHPRYVDRDATGQLLQWASMVADFEPDALFAVVNSPGLVDIYGGHAFVPYRRVEVQDGIGQGSEAGESSSYQLLGGCIPMLSCWKFLLFVLSRGGWPMDVSDVLMQAVILGR